LDSLKPTLKEQLCQVNYNFSGIKDDRSRLSNKRPSDFSDKRAFLKATGEGPSSQTYSLAALDQSIKKSKSSARAITISPYLPQSKHHQPYSYEGLLDNYNYSSMRELPTYSFGTAKRTAKDESAWDLCNATRDVRNDYYDLEFKCLGRVGVPEVIREGRQFIQ